MNTERHEKILVKINAELYGVYYDENDIVGTQKRIDEAKQSASKLEKVAEKLGVVGIKKTCKGDIPCILKEINKSNKKRIEETIDKANKESEKRNSINRRRL